MMAREKRVCDGYWYYLSTISFDLQKHNEMTAKEIREQGGEAHAYTCDVSDQETVAHVASKVWQLSLPI